jgi:predicted DNA-binding transcriptional regulator AlpA
MVPAACQGTAGDILNREFFAAAFKEVRGAELCIKEWSPKSRSDQLTIPRDQQSPYPGGQRATAMPAVPGDQADMSANSARGPPTPTGPVELWGRETVLKFFGGDTPLHHSTLYRGMVAKRYPRPVNVAGNAARWLRSECEDALQCMIAARDEPTKPERRGRPRRRIIPDNA